jgi:hypothetical protein
MDKWFLKSNKAQLQIPHQPIVEGKGTHKREGYEIVGSTSEEEFLDAKIPDGNTCM